MKSFKHFSGMLSWNSTGTSTSMLCWPSGFSEIRNNDVSEAMKPIEHFDYAVDIHKLPDLRPREMDDKMKESVVHYTTTPSDHATDAHRSSGNINAYLRNKAGDKTNKVRNVEMNAEGHKKIKSAISSLSKAFNSNTTNRRAVISYSGVPKYIGEKLANSESGSKHVLAGFTSTSTSPYTAQGFAKNHAQQEKGSKKQYHVLKMNVQPGAGLSVKHITPFDHEHEITLHHGAKITYHHTTSEKTADGATLHTHHVTVHKSKLPLSKYGEYTGE